MKHTLFWCAALMIAGAAWAAEPAANPATLPPEQKPPAWYDTLKFKGDLRYRMEWIDRKDWDHARRRDRLRIRIGLDADLGDGLSLRGQLASGSDDPVSANQTLGSSFTGKPVRLDLAYLDWKPEGTGYEVQAGKVPLPFICVSDMIWDPAVNPEGMGGFWKQDTDLAVWTAQAGYWWITEDPLDTDTFLYTGQVSAQWKLAPDLRLLTGGSAYVYDSLQGQSMLYGGKSYGNSTVDLNAAQAESEDYEPDLTFAEDYSLVEGFTQLDWDAFIPVTLYAHTVSNLAADDENFGWLAGVTFGRARAVRSMEAGFNYRSVQKDAAVGAFTDANSGGGGTDVEGFRFYLRYQATRALQLAASFYLQKLDPDGQNLDYGRVQLEALARF